MNQTLKITMGAMFVALTAIGTNITSLIPFLVIGGVPITLQVFFAVLAGLVLGSRVGAFSMFAYMMLGLAGAPVFAGFKGGASALFSPTFGFIISFIIAAYIAGKIRERYPSVTMYITAAIVATLFSYVFGTNWMYIAYMNWFDAPANFTYKLAVLWMAVPFPKDMALAVCAGLFAYRLEKSGLVIRIPAKVKQEG